MNSPMRQAAPITRLAAAAEILLSFPRPTLANAILIAAFLLPRAALASVSDDRGGRWRAANVTLEHSLGRLEVWYRPGGERHWKSAPLLGIDRIETVPAPAGVTEVLAKVCNAQRLALAGLAIEFRRHCAVGEAVQAAHELVRVMGMRALAQAPADPSNQLQSNFEVSP